MSEQIIEDNVKASVLAALTCAITGSAASDIESIVFKCLKDNALQINAIRKSGRAVNTIESLRVYNAQDAKLADFTATLGASMWAIVNNNDKSAKIADVKRSECKLPARKDENGNVIQQEGIDAGPDAQVVIGALVKLIYPKASVTSAASKPRERVFKNEAERKAYEAYTAKKAALKAQQDALKDERKALAELRKSAGIESKPRNKPAAALSEASASAANVKEQSASAANDKSTKTQDALNKAQELRKSANRK